MSTDKKITPTLTLAQIYDAQKQYFDAYTIYSKLYQSSPSEDLKERKEASEKKIFTDMSFVYNEILSSIFTEADRVKFKILPDENHQNLLETLQNTETDETAFVADEFDENENDLSDAEEIEDIYPDIPNYQAELDNITKIPTTYTFDEELIRDIKPPDLTNLTLSEFAQHIIKKVKSDKKLSDLTLKEIKEIKNIFKELF